MTTRHGQATEEFSRFVEIIARLRDPNGGCPWDLAQTNKTIRPYLLEETYEVLEAIDSEHDGELVKELGDVLLQVALHSQIASDRQAFDIVDVLTKVSDKLVSRHPHVFGDVKASNPHEASKSWEKMKLKEKQDAPGTLFSGVPKSLPALLRASRISEKASFVGFDWPSIDGVIDKVKEELAELEDELQKSTGARSLCKPQEIQLAERDRKALEHELGDLFFALTQACRWLGISAEDALRSCCDRFSERFYEMERTIGAPLSELTPEELDARWQEAKKKVDSGN